MPLPRSVAIDVTAPVHQGGGIGRYARCLVTALAQARPPLRLTLFWTASPRRPIPAWLLHLPGVRLRRLPVPERLATILWQRARLPLPVEALLGPQEVCHFPDFVMPPLLRARGVLTVHDLSFRRVPEAAALGLRRYLNRVVPRSVRRADLVRADSAPTRRDLTELLGAPPGKTAVLYSGVGPEFRPLHDPERLAAVRRRYGLPERFILSLGTIQPRKNYARLIRAYARLHHSGPQAPHLVIAGRPGWLSGDLVGLVERLGVGGRVHFLRDATDADLPALYALAEVFALVSLYEGFGLPPLEAMACGTPVLVSDVSSLPEVVEGAGLLVDPFDVDAIAAALERLLGDAALRRQLAERGLAQAARFTWAHAAEELLGFYARVAGA